MKTAAGEKTDVKSPDIKTNKKQEVLSQGATLSTPISGGRGGSGGGGGEAPSPPGEDDGKHRERMAELQRRLDLYMSMGKENPPPIAKVSMGVMKLNGLGEFAYRRRFPNRISKARAPFDYGLFATTEESDYSSLMPYQVEQVSSVLVAAVPEDVKTITDATTCIGVDAINWARLFPKAAITALEINEATFDILTDNIETFKEAHPEYAQITAHCADAAKFMLEEKNMTDVVYIDPPRGGPDYHKVKSLMLKVGALTLTEFVLKLFTGGARIIIAKVPPNFAFGEFKAALSKCTITEHEIVKPYHGGKKGNVAFKLMTIKPKA
jgi:predicted O-methyltransferase YrrM